MNNKWLILLDLSLQLCRAGSYSMWKALLMKVFQPLASSSNNILDLPCQQTCLETWLPSQTWQKHHQVQKTNWWAFWKGTTRGRSVSVIFHSKRKLFRRKNRRLFAVFVHYDKNLPFLDRSKYWNEGKGSSLFSRIWSRHPRVLVPTSGRHTAPPVSRAHLLSDRSRVMVMPALELQPWAPSCPDEEPKRCSQWGMASRAITQGSPVSTSPDWCQQMTEMTATTWSILA